MVFYILFFASGCMGGSALVLMHIRRRNRLISYLLSVQALFLLGMTLVMFIYELEPDTADGPDDGASLVLKASGRTRKMRISGIYRDITNGGRTAKAAIALSRGNQIFSENNPVAAWRDRKSDAAEQYPLIFSGFQANISRRFQGMVLGSFKGTV